MTDVLTHGETMNRLIHQAVRRDLGRFETALASFTPGDRPRAEALGAAFEHFDTMLTAHHEGEEHNLWPVIGDPAGGHEGDVAHLTTEHEEIVAGLSDSRAAFARLRTSASAQDAAAAAAGLGRLRAAATTHFAHEEAQMRDLMQAADQDALATALKKMGRDAPPAQGMWFMQWVQDDLTGEQSAALGRILPAPVRLASKVVAGRRYARVRTAAFG
jgi:hypothetical protein